jgi:hypothetical protein
MARQRHRTRVGATLVVALMALAALAGCDHKKGLRITSVEPKTGPYTGGTVITLNGSGFMEGGAKGVKIYFNDREATRVYIEGDDKIKVEPPPGEINETVDILLVFDDARDLKITQAYTYQDFTNTMGADALVKPKDKE